MTIEYTPRQTFALKDSLGPTNPDKILSGVDFDAEFGDISAALQLAAPSLNPSFTGTVTASAMDVSGALTAGTVNGTDTADWDATTSTLNSKEAGWDDTKTTVDTASPTWNATAATVTLKEADWDSAYVNSITGGSFNTNNGDLTLTKNVGSETVNLDGRYGVGGSQSLTGGTNITVSGSNINLDSSISGLTDVTTSAISIGSWEIKLDGSDLRFVYNGSDKMRISTTGQIIALSDITAYGAP